MPHSALAAGPLTDDNSTGYTVAKWPTTPQEFDLNGRGLWDPQMPDPQPFLGNTGKRKALIVCDRQTMYHTLIFIGVQGWDQLFYASSTRLQVTEVH